MKKLALAGLIAITGTAAMASGLVTPAPMMVGGVVVPLLLLLLVAALAN